MKAMLKLFAAVAAVCGAVAFSPAFGDWVWEDQSKLYVTDGRWHLTLTPTTYGSVSGYEVPAQGVRNPKPTDRDEDGYLVLDLRGLPVDLIKLRGAWVNAADKLCLPDTLVFPTGFSGTGFKRIEPFLPKSVLRVENQLFYGCKNLAGDLRIEKAVLERDAFNNGCTNITSITLGKGVTSVPYSIFSGCSGVTNITMLGGVTSLAGYCFSGMTRVKEITFSSKPSMSTDNTGSFGGWIDYQAKMRIPEELFGSWCTASTFVEWDEATHRALYEASFPGDTNTPRGVYTALPGYNRAKSKQWLFTYKPDLSAVVKLAVEGSFNDAVPFPAYGSKEYDYEEGFSLRCTNTQYCAGLYNDSAHCYRVYECYEGVVEQYKDDAWSVVATNAGCAFTFAPAEAGSYRLTWHWKQVGFTMPSVTAPTLSDVGTVVSSTPQNGWWCLQDEVMTYTVEEGKDGTFTRWYGDVPADQITNRTVSIVVSRYGMGVRVHLDCPYWVYGSGYLTDGDWYFTASGARDAITIGSGTTYGNTRGNPTHLLDFTKPVKDGGKIVGLNRISLMLQNQQAQGSALSIWDLRLPKTMEYLDSRAVDGQTFITNVTYNSYPRIADDAFTDCRFAQMLWQVPARDWDAFLTDRTKLEPWGALGATTQALWKASGKKPLGLTTGFNRQWVRCLPDVGMKLLFR